MSSKVGKIKIAIIGGSGLYGIDGLKNIKEVKVKTPFGSPSDAIITGVLEGVSVAFLPRHGRGHKYLPCEIPQKANIWALKSLGVETLISVSAVGSLREKLKPRHFVFPNQLVNQTRGRCQTFFGNGIVAHGYFAEPFCAELSNLLYKTSKKLRIPSHKGGALVCMQGPQFSTKAESHTNRKLGYDLIGMTAVPEANLAREASMCYAPISLVTDYDCWKEGEEVTSEKVMATMAKNVDNAKKLLKKVIPLIAKAKKKCACKNLMKNSVVTDSSVMPAKTKKALKLIMKDM
ncbi:MAG TPA: S-methyl-5'-thioadenosine phosphorylase [Elusimicrobiales bacterium]|nr:S-methyl-5'-thioadenosine phosphorylase [Elusimicrobiales bacterium]